MHKSERFDAPPTAMVLKSIWEDALLGNDAASICVRCQEPADDPSQPNLTRCCMCKCCWHSTCLDHTVEEWDTAGWLPTWRAVKVSERVLRHTCALCARFCEVGRKYMYQLILNAIVNTFIQKKQAKSEIVKSEMLLVDKRQAKSAKSDIVNIPKATAV